MTTILSARRAYGAEVRRARRTNRISISGPHDFACGARTAFAGAASSGEILLPYCLDAARKRSLYIAGADAAAAQAAPFYYLHLRRTAKRLVSVPWEMTPLSGKAGASPILVFSPGRVGSTLLSAILVEAGIANVSEPDFYTQATTSFAAGPFNPRRHSMAKAARDLGRDLAAAIGEGGPVVAKLRAECCRAPQLIVEGERPKTVFMTRAFEPWARSTGRVFRAGPARAVAKYLQSLAAYDWLLRHTDCHLVLYDELVSDPGSRCTALGRFLGRDISPDAAARALASDSQQGTPLEQEARPPRAGWEKTLEDTLALWRSDKLRRRREKLPLYDG
jgi:hypothetical protein